MVAASSVPLAASRRKASAMVPRPGTSFGGNPPKYARACQHAAITAKVAIGSAMESACLIAVALSLRARRGEDAAVEPLVPVGNGGNLLLLEQRLRFVVEIGFELRPEVGADVDLRKHQLDHI